MKKIANVLLAVLVVTSLLLAACTPKPAPTEAPAATQPPAEEKGLIVVGSKDFSEQYILGYISVIALEAAGFEVDDQVGLGGTAVNREALLAGEIDLYWEYTGTGWMAHLEHEEPITDPQECYDEVKAEDAGNGLVWLNMAPFNNTYTLMMQQTVGDDLGVKSISDLAEYINGGGDASLCINQEFYARPDGFKGVEALYGSNSQYGVKCVRSGGFSRILSVGQSPGRVLMTSRSEICHELHELMPILRSSFVKIRAIRGGKCRRPDEKYPITLDGVTIASKYTRLKPLLRQNENCWLYGFQFDEAQVIMMDSGLTYKALQDGECTTAMGFATDGRIAAFGFFNLKDDKQYFPVYNPAPVVRQEIMDQYPGIATVLDPVAKALTTEKMMEMNKQVDIDEQDPEDVACDFLMSEGLVDSCP